LLSRMPVEVEVDLTAPAAHEAQFFYNSTGIAARSLSFFILNYICMIRLVTLRSGKWEPDQTPFSPKLSGVPVNPDGKARSLGTFTSFYPQGAQAPPFHHDALQLIDGQLALFFS
jgi:hypothetical protein